MSDVNSSGWEVSQPPLVGGSVEEIAAGLYVIPDRRVPLVPNVGIVVGDRAALVVDCGLGPDNGRAVREAAATVAGDRPLLLTTTHFHPEHASGAQAFADGPTFVANRTQRDELRDKGPGYLDMFRGLGEVVAERLEGVEIALPQLVYDTVAELDLGGRVVQLRAHQPAHTRGDQTILVPDESILFCGDLAEAGFFPIVPYFPPHDVDVDGDGWIELLDQLAGSSPRVVVPGHGAIGGVEVLADVAGFLRRTRERTHALLAAGRDPEQIVSELTPELQALHPDWDNAVMIAPAIGCFAASAALTRSRR